MAGTTKTIFSKPAATPANLLAKLKAQGLVVPPHDENRALAYLGFVGAYRLKGYWHHLIDPSSKLFPPGYAFQSLVDRYEFDRDLRAIAISAIDRLEVAVRVAMANYLSLKHSPHWFLNTNIFKPVREWGVGQLIRKIEEEVGRSSERAFVEHYFTKHDDPYLPPSWAISECVTFGLWSRTYQILRFHDDQKAICKRFGIDEPEVFRSWIHTITVLRNIAAHHGQFLRVKIRVAPANYKRANIKFSDHKSFFASATIINFLLNQVGLPQQWKTDLQSLFAKYPTIQISELGFPSNWANSPGW